MEKTTKILFSIYQVMEFFSLRGYSLIAWIVLGVVLLIREKNKKIVIVHTVLAAGVAGLLTYAIKILTQIPRPYEIGYLCPEDYTFPSLHASIAFAVATIYVYHHPRAWWFAYGLAFCVAFSRVWLGCHYTLDVAIGALLGYICSSLIVRIYRRDK